MSWVDNKCNNLGSKWNGRTLPENTIACPEIIKKDQVVDISTFKTTTPSRSKITYIGPNYKSSAKKKLVAPDYKKVYFTFFGFTEGDFIPCEVCEAESVDIHHIHPKGMGGSIEKNYIENLVALCREHHDKCHDIPSFNAEVRIKHLTNVLNTLKWNSVHVEGE